MLFGKEGLHPTTIWTFHLMKFLVVLLLFIFLDTNPFKCSGGADSKGTCSCYATAVDIIAAAEVGLSAVARTGSSSETTSLEVVLPMNPSFLIG